MDVSPDYLTFADREAWRAWLEQNHAGATEVWLIHRKKRAGGQSVGYEEAVEEALCFGWIDGRLRSLDAERYVLRYSPRTSRSVWAESNKRRVERLIAEGRMTAAGLAKVQEAKADGRWDAVDDLVDIDTIPGDLAEALKQDPSAWDAFQSWSPSHKRQYLYWVTSAKKPETRQRRVLAIVEKAAETMRSRKVRPASPD